MAHLWLKKIQVLPNNRVVLGKPSQYIWLFHSVWQQSILVECTPEKTDLSVCVLLGKPLVTTVPTCPKALHTQFLVHFAVQVCNYHSAPQFLVLAHLTQEHTVLLHIH
jgi:hypothetical protein